MCCWTDAVGQVLRSGLTMDGRVSGKLAGNLPERHFIVIPETSRLVKTNLDMQLAFPNVPVENLQLPSELEE